MTTDGSLIGDAILVEQPCQEFNLVDAGVKHVILGVFIKTDSESLHVTTVHAAIGEVALKGDTVGLGSLIPVFPTGGDETAHVDDGIFLGAHGHAVGEVKHFLDNLLDGLVGISILAGLDKIGILGKAG